MYGVWTVSYTHLDVYKRQPLPSHQQPLRHTPTTHNRYYIQTFSVVNPIEEDEHYVEMSGKSKPKSKFTVKVLIYIYINKEEVFNPRWRLCVARHLDLEYFLLSFLFAFEHCKKEKLYEMNTVTQCINNNVTHPYSVHPNSYSLYMLIRISRKVRTSLWGWLV